MRVSIILLVASALGACSSSTFELEGKALGRVDTVDEAAADAQLLTSLVGPVTVLNVRRGIARDIYTGAYPSFVSGMPGMEQAHQRFVAKLDRAAWRVDVTGEPTPGLHGCCRWEELIIDEETGSVLFTVGADAIPENE